MSDKIVPMPPPVELIDKDLELTERACRNLAERYRQRGDLERAGHFERIAERIKITRQSQ
jgi:hypothetical protein